MGLIYPGSENVNDFSTDTFLSQELSSTTRQSRMREGITCDFLFTSEGTAPDFVLTGEGTAPDFVLKGEASASTTSRPVERSCGVISGSSAAAAALFADLVRRDAVCFTAPSMCISSLRLSTSIWRRPHKQMERSCDERTEDFMAQVEIKVQQRTWHPQDGC